MGLFGTNMGLFGTNMGLYETLGAIRNISKINKNVYLKI